jgi:hypothetical protein
MKLFIFFVKSNTVPDQNALNHVEIEIRLQHFVDIAEIAFEKGLVDVIDQENGILSDTDFCHLYHAAQASQAHPDDTVAPDAERDFKTAFHAVALCITVELGRKAFETELVRLHAVEQALCVPAIARPEKFGTYTRSAFFQGVTGGKNKDTQQAGNQNGREIKRSSCFIHTVSFH